MADLTGGRPEGVILGPNMTTLTYRLARTLAAGWGPGDEVVVTRLDHDANVRPWVAAAVRAGAGVRFADVALPEGDLQLAQLAELISDQTRLVAVTAASNLIGTRPDVAGITALAHAAGALSYVDGVHATPHGPVDVAGLGADFYVTSAYKWSGPHVGAVVADPGLLESLAPDKLVPAPDSGPDRFEQGTLPFADLAGVTAAVDHLASLAGPAPGPGPGTRRERILAGLAAAEAHEQDLFRVLLGGLDALDHVTTYGKAARRTATAYFTVAGRTPRQVAEHLATRKVNVWDGDNYAWELAGALGLRDSAARCERGWCTTTTGPTWTGCSRPSRNWPADRSVLEGVPVQAGVAELEPGPLVEPPGRLARGARGQVHGPRAGRAGQPQRLLGHRLPGALATRRLIDDHVLDPGAQPGREREHHQGRRTGDPPPGAGDQHRVRRAAHDRLEFRLPERRGGPGQLREQAAESLDHLAGYLVEHLYLDCHPAYPTGLAPGRVPALASTGKRAGPGGRSGPARWPACCGAPSWRSPAAAGRGSGAAAWTATASPAA